MSIPDPASYALGEAAALTAAIRQNGHGPPSLLLRAAGSTFDKIEPQSVDWLWRDVIARGHLAEITGVPGVGKSLLTTNLASALSTGRPLPGQERTDPRGVVMLSYEDDAGSVIRPRLEVAGADLSRIFCMQGVVSDDDERDAILPNDLDALRDAISRVDAGLVIIDPILTALDGKIDTHKDADVKRALRPLTQFAQETHVALLVVRHPNKATGGRAINRPGGSIGLTGTARLSSLLAVDPDDPDRRVLTAIKSNLGMLHPAWSFRITSEGGAAWIVWDAVSRKLTADDLLASEHADSDERSALAEVTEWLRETLSYGPHPVKGLQAQARNAGFHWRTVERAKARLGLKARRSGFGPGGTWEWAYDDQEGCPPDDVA